MSENSLEDRIRIVEARLLELEDDRAIRQVLARYGFHADQGRHDDWVALFAPDGAVEYAVNKAMTQAPATRDNGPGTATPDNEAYPRSVGAEQLRKLISNPDGGHKSIEGRSLHIMGLNLKTTITGNRAIAECYSLVFVRDGSHYDPVAMSAGRWTLEKTDGEWLITESKRRLPGSAGFEDIL